MNEVGGEEGTMTEAEFLTKWRARLDELARLDAQVSGAKLCGEVLADFDALSATAQDASLTLQEAAAHSGYSPDHLRRLIREGRLPAQRRGRRYLFRAGDLPRKPVTVDVPPTGAYDPLAHARQVANRRSHGGSTP